MLPLKKLLFYKKLASKKFSVVKSRLDNAGFTWTKGAIIMASTTIILILMFDIYFSVQSAVENYKLLEFEEQRLQQTEEEASELSQEIEYYSSLEFRQRYAYDSLNLARAEERLYAVQTADRQQFEIEEVNSDPIAVEDEQLWWDLLFDEARENLSLSF
jgi:hypothetical protein